jgi:hypothetical protein
MQKLIVDKRPPLWLRLERPQAVKIMAIKLVCEQGLPVSQGPSLSPRSMPLIEDTLNEVPTRFSDVCQQSLAMLGDMVI